jgi:hypothetical protein
MMRLISAEVEWHEQYLNHPNLVLRVDKLPCPESMIYEERNKIFYAERFGYVSFFYYSTPGDGYGGREFPITMKDGTSRILKGPWSSRASCVNRQGFGPCLDVTLLEGNGSRYGAIAGAVTLHYAQRALLGLPGVYLVPLTDVHGEVTFTPSYEPGRIVKPTLEYGNPDSKTVLKTYDKLGNLVDIA